MGLFDSEQTSESRLELPGYMQNIPGMLSGEMQQLIGQDFLSPDELVAALNPAQIQAFNNMIAYGGGQAQDAAANIYGQGMQGVGAFGQGQQAMQQLLGANAPQNMGVDMGYVGSMIDNDVLQGQIDAALRDPYRAFTEQQLPSAQLSAAASGNTGSTRRGVGEAILQRGYEDRAADIAGGIRGQAYGQALGIGAQQAAQNPMLQAGFQNLQAGLAGDLMGSGMNAANMLNMANAMAQGGFNQQQMGGAGFQNQEQQLLNAGLQGFMFPYQQLQMLAPLAGNMAQTYGTRVNEQTSDPGIGNTILGGAMGLGSAAMMGGFNPFSFIPNMFGGQNNFTPGGYTSAANIFG